MDMGCDGGHTYHACSSSFQPPSNGARDWSQGPPKQDAIMIIAYFKAYFNSIDPKRQRVFEARCKDQNTPGAICRVPDQISMPDPLAPKADQSPNTDTGASFFSTMKNHGTGQIVHSRASSSIMRTSWTLTIAAGGLLLAQIL
jgi:hypothetical protein